MMCSKALDISGDPFTHMISSVCLKQGKGSEQGREIIRNQQIAQLEKKEGNVRLKEKEFKAQNADFDGHIAYRCVYGPDGREYKVDFLIIEDGTAKKTDKCHTGGENHVNGGAHGGQTVKVQQADRQEISKLEDTDYRVKLHEQAHLASGAQYTGGVRYRYVKGPDGQLYAEGGEVDISVPEGRTPEETVQIMTAVKNIALSPADPSLQDMKVAAYASRKQVEAIEEIRKRDIKALEGPAGKSSRMVKKKLEQYREYVRVFDAGSDKSKQPEKTGKSGKAMPAVNILV